MANPRWTDSSVPRSLPERVAQLYYTHGLNCASRPFIVLILSIFFIFTCSYPLRNLPLPGNVPQHFTDNGNSSMAVDAPRWFHTSSPFCYIQQVIMKTAVSPWTDDLMLTDAYRAPLAEVFSLLEVIQNYQHPNSSLTLADICLHVESVKKKQEKKVLPEYSCLVLSPANLWHQDVHRYHSDVNLISTIYSYQNLQKGKVSLTEILFGLNLKDTGIKRYPLRKRQRIIQFAVTLFLRNYDKHFLNGLQEHLAHFYPLHQSSGSTDLNKTLPENSDSVLHIYYPSEFDYYEFVPLGVTYVLLFLYIYFSVRKIELVRSKIGIAVSAVFTVFFSLTMSTGLCFFFGLELAGGGRGREVFPYLVVVVGLENVLVLTKSVVSTAPHLDVKIRIAQGLSREGWSITKNLLTEVTILTIGLITLVPAIQEFCIFAIVGLLSDFFLQMVFFTTILSLDIRQTDTVSEPAQSFLHLRYNPTRNAGLSRSRSHPRLSNAVGPPKIPKRLKLVNFWANTRIFQRAFMVGMVVWIGGIIYSAGVLERFVSVAENDMSTLAMSTKDPLMGQYRSSISEEEGRRASMLNMEEKLLASHRHTLKQVQDDTDLLRLRPSDYEPWRRLSPHHWSTVLTLHNNTPLAGSYITLLPAIHLASPVPPDRAVTLRNPFEKQMPQFQWHSLALALDPLDLSDADLDIRQVLPTAKLSSESPFLPSSPMELFLSAVLCVVSIVVLAYCVIVLYRCICSRNYAEWRASWGPEKDSVDNSTQVILEAVPLVLESHPQEVECLASDGNIVVSSCLAGEVRCWDAATGELNIVIKREVNTYYDYHVHAGSPGAEDSPDSEFKFSGKRRSPKKSCDEEMLYKELSVACNTEVQNDTIRSRYKPPDRTQFWDLPDLTPAIATNFTSQNLRTCNDVNHGTRNGFDYGPRIRNLFEEFKQEKLLTVENGDCECKCSGGGGKCERRKRTSLSDDGGDYGDTEHDSLVDSVVDPEWTVSPIWCLDCQDSLIVIGCANGRMEFWNSSTGTLKYVTDEVGGAGLTCVRLVGGYVVAARLNGALDIYTLSWHGSQTIHRRTHIRTGSAGSPLDWTANETTGDEKLCCVRVSSNRAHQQPITVMDVEGGRVLTGSQDHTLKVVGLSDQVIVYTLHGHCGPITALFIDRITPTTAGSGSQDGMLCVWDLLTGACMYSLQAHDGFIMALSYSPSYIISLGADERLCVWERFQGHLLNTINVNQTYCISMVMLTHNLLITSKQGSLVVWDVRTGEPVRLVKLGLSDSCVFVQHIVPLRNSIACDYGRQLRIVRFPLVRDKTE